MWLHINNGESKELTLAPGQTQCFYNLKAQEWEYKITKPSTSMYHVNLIGEGQVLIEKCKSKTFLIK